MKNLRLPKSLVFQGLDCDAMRISSRIGGPDSCRVRPNSKPWMVRLALKNEKNASKAHICGGTLISEHHVLTAKHCLNKSPKELILDSMIVVVGDHILSENDGEQFFDIKDIEYYSSIKGTIKVNIIKQIIMVFVLFELISLYV